MNRYKGYGEPTTVEIAPLTILMGANNSGKTALARAIQLLAGSLTLSGDDTAEPLPLTCGGVRHGRVFEDLVTGRSAHGSLALSVVLAHGGCESSLAVTVQNVLKPFGPSERQISRWSLGSGGVRIEATRRDLSDHSPYAISVSGAEQGMYRMSWRGVLPKQPNQLPDWVEAQTDKIREWASGVRYLQCPRSFSASFSSMEESFLRVNESKGQSIPRALVSDDDLKDAVRAWYRRVFGVSLDVEIDGSLYHLKVRSPGHDAKVLLSHSGGGLSQVLPVVVAALTANRAGPGVDIIEHPEAKLYPAAHAEVAELFLSSLSGSVRPVIVETHSEMVLLRARRWIAEGRLPSDHVLVYWVDTEPGNGAVLQKISINERGEMSTWPHGVFIEDYEEILAIRRAARQTSE